MPLISKFKDIFKGGSSAKKKKHFHNVRLDNPEEFWEIIGELGDGAYGKVYKAVHKETKQLAALKQVALEEEEDLETFMIEIDILSECKHENIVELLEAYHYNGKLWMYLEYCDGGAMDSIMADLYRPLTEPQIAYVCKYLVNALVYIHEQKVIHRDLKAGNVLLTMEGGVKLADFGVSAKNKNTYDKRGTFIGTPYWLAPEVILCETFIDAKYDYKADVWSLGISLIEFAQMDPPNHEVSPVRVMLKIQKSDPPKLDYPSKYSKEFNDFISKCLVKDPALRPSAVELLQHPFISKDLDVKPIRDLLLEYKAEIVDEEVYEDGDDQRISRISEDDPSQEESFSVTPTTVSKIQDSTTTLVEENKSPSPGKDENEVVAPVTGERRKGPAPPPPVSGSLASTTTTSASSTPKKGPAPAVPASTTPSKPRAPSPVDITSNDFVGESGDNTSPSSTTNEQVTSTPSGKGPAPKPVPIGESPVPKEKHSPTLPKTDIPCIENIPSVPNENENVNEKQLSVSHASEQDKKTVLQEKMETDEKPMRESDTQDPKSNSKADVVDNANQATNRVSEEEKDKRLSSAQNIPEIETTTTSNEMEKQTENTTVGVSVLIDTTEQKQTEKALSSVVDNTEHKTVISPLPAIPSIPTLAFSTPDLLTLVSSESQVTPVSDQATNESRTSVPVGPASVSLSASSPEAVIASIGSDATVIVRTPTPTPPETSQGQPPVKKESVVTYSGSSVILTPDKEEEVNTSVMSDQVVVADRVVVPDAVAKDKTESVTEVQVISNDGHKLDESEVVISSSSIPHEEMDTHPEPESSTKSRYEITLEETGKVEVVLPTVTSTNDTTHISVVAVDDLSEAELPKGLPPSQDTLSTVKTPVPASVDPKAVTNRSPVQSEPDNQGHLETSSNISNISNLSGGTASTGRSLSSAEEENRPTVSLLIEGTTVGATDVDDDVFDHNEHHDSKTVKDNSHKKPALVRELTIGSEVSVESGVSTGSTVSTPTHQNDYSQQNTPIAHSPGTKILPNGIGRDGHRLSESRSEWDNISTTSSERDNRHRERDDESLDEVVLRRSQHSDLADVTLQPLEKNRDSRNTRMTKQESDLVALRKKTRKRTRKFVVDGVLVTTRQVFYEDEGMGTGHFARKQELRELKILQKIEQKQFQELGMKANFARVEQEKKFDLERQQLLRGYDTDIEALNRQQKQQVEKAEALQEVELKNASKKIRAEQERELKAFRESLKTELKLLKQEIDLLPKDKRKEAFKSRKERLDEDQSEREKSFLEKLHEAHEVSLKRLGDDHRERIALLERQFLQQKHQLLRSRESALWEMEERHLHEKHQLSKRQLKDIFFLQRHQMLLRHEKELEQVKRVNQQKEEELVKRQQIEKRQLPKRIRQEMKARELMFRESMRISTFHLPDSHEDEKNKLKKFQENEKRRYEAEKKRAEQKHQRKLEELQASSEYTVKELEQLQNEKRKMLMEHETNKLKSQDEEYQREVREWKDNLKPRKQKLEEEFEKQLNEQEQFYGAYLSRSLGSSMTPSQSTSSLARSNTS
ncbi:STE20-like serine/threonine-protein kinase isoform X6 [Cherax quadricarinatus]|uniref:STE20-like serine/threonine-protein kinase isoform X6 n=1 Tax=Cherax quadricarinatus TaxID=27406 RepID=UPI00387E724D